MIRNRSGAGWVRSLGLFYPGLVLALFLTGCKLEKPDPASQALAILHKRAGFLDQLTSLDAMVAEELSHGLVGNIPTGPSNLAESLSVHVTRLRPLVAMAMGSRKAEVISSWIFDTLGLEAVSGPDRLQASLPSRVLASRQGSSLGISLLCLAYGDALGIPLKPMILPGHVSIGYFGETTVRMDLQDPNGFSHRIALATAGEAQPRQALAMLVNLLGEYHLESGDSAIAHQEFEIVESLLPGLSSK